MASWNEILKQADSRVIEKIKEWKLDGLLASEEVPSAGDRKVAWEVRVELQTRITTQKLNFLDGDEGTALKSVYNLFQPARELLKKEGLNGPRSAAVVELMLNAVVRPFTAEWHRRKLAGDLARDDATAEFRRALEKLRSDLGAFSALLRAIATDVFPASSVSPVPDDKRSKALAESLQRSIPFDRLLGYPDSGRPTQSDTQAVAIVQAEQQEVSLRRQAVGLAAGHDDLVGMAISGGGIRSATFALGVIQGLARRGVFRQIDLLSTVSGGGYLGAFLSSMLNTAPVELSGQLPGGQPLRATAVDPFESNGEPDPKSIRFLRNHSRYILPATFWNWMRTVGQAAYGVVSNLLILSPFVFLAVLLTHVTMKDQLVHLAGLVRWGKPAPDDVWTLGWGSCGALALAVLHLLYLPSAQSKGRLGGKYQEIAIRYENQTLLVFAFALSVVVLDYLPLAHFGFLKWMHWLGVVLGISDDASGGWSLRATLTSIASIAGLIAARSESIRMIGQTIPLLRKVLFLFLWLAGPGLFAYAYFELCRVYVAVPPEHSIVIAGIHLDVWPIGLMLILLILSSLYAFSINVNFTSLHRFYRNRLAETFLLKQSGDVVKSTEEEQLGRTQQLLSGLRAKGSTAPYHLINAALNLPSSDDPELRGRACDFFLFSKHFCGSRVTKYYATTAWENLDPHLDLGTAVAISGAAAAPQMGLGSIRGASFLLTLINIRLGYWLRQPAKTGKLTETQRARAAPGPKYLWREAWNSIDEKAEYLNVSDGGHIENLGLYELLKRRCKYIIAIDGECDPELDCPSLMRVQHFAKVDLGVEIDIDIRRLKWVEVTPAEAKPTEDEQGAEAIVRAVRKPTRFSRGHFAVGAIKYPSDDLTGVFIYVKLSITGNEPDYIHDYRRQHPEFPHQSTGDQVFEDDQFEAYRGLGEHIAQDLFSSEVLRLEPNDRTIGIPIPVPAWCRKLFETFHRPRFRDPDSL